jgi:hypothetical protein
MKTDGGARVFKEGMHEIWLFHASIPLMLVGTGCGWLSLVWDSSSLPKVAIAI